MKSRIWIILFIGAIIIFLGFKSKKEVRHCKKGKFSYAIATYKDEFFIKKQYSQLFDSIFQNSMLDFFCENKIKGLPGQNQMHQKTSKSISIEPFFVDLKNNDGLYGYRSWNTAGLNPRFTCGYFHYLFVISDNTYYSLKDDSLENVNILRNKLSNSFSEEQIERMISWGVRSNYFCNSYTFDWPMLIKKDSLIIWNIDTKI